MGCSERSGPPIPGSRRIGRRLMRWLNVRRIGMSSPQSDTWSGTPGGAHRTEEDGVVITELVEGIRGHHRPCPEVVSAAPVVLLPGERHAVASHGSVGQRHRGRNDLAADPVSGKQRNAVSCCRWAVGHGHRRYLIRVRTSDSRPQRSRVVGGSSRRVTLARLFRLPDSLLGMTGDSGATVDPPNRYGRVIAAASRSQSTAGRSSNETLIRMMDARINSPRPPTRGSGRRSCREVVTIGPSRRELSGQARL